MSRIRAISIVAFSSMILFLIYMIPPGFAHLGTPIDSGWAATTPTIDGNITSGEWANATVRDFTLEMRSRVDGSFNRTLDARMYVKNDWANLYVAVEIFNDTYAAQDFAGRYKGFAILFDDNHTGTLSDGDNGEGVTTWVSSPFYSKNDLYYSAGSWDADANAGKVNDGNLSWSHTNPVQGALGNWTFETRILLVGSDGDAYDFNITGLPRTVGFKIWFQEVYWQKDGVYPDDPSITTNIDETTNASTFGNLTIHPLYTLTTVATTGGTTNPAPGSYQYPYRTNVSVTAIPNAMYEFDHLELDSVNVGATNPYTVMMDQNHTLKAVFHPLYALTIVTTTGGTTNPAPGVYIHHNGTVVNVTAIQNPGYEFDHWERDSVDVGTANPYSILMDQNHTLKAFFVEELSVTISPMDITINLGQHVDFSSIASGGTTPYSYQWYVGTTPASGATSDSWTFTPTSTGIYYVYLNVTDYRGRIALSDTARVVVIYIPVGGYTVSIDKASPNVSLVCYAAFLLASGGLAGIGRRRKKQTA